MSGLLWNLIPLILGNILVPSQVAITLLLLLRPRGGTTAAIALIAGILTMRVVQGLVFGLILTSVSSAHGKPFTGPLVYGGFVGLGLLLYAAAMKMALTNEDPDDPPPRWLTMASSMSPKLAFGVGAALPLVGAKFWVFTLSAVAAVRDARLGYLGASLAFVLYAALSCALLIGMVALRVTGTPRSVRILEGSAAWLKRHNKAVALVLGAVFGTWFLITGLAGLI
ncbi:MAG TPA: GAP family protein [Microlunatus sp.]